MTIPSAGISAGISVVDVERLAPIPPGMGPHAILMLEGVDGRDLDELVAEITGELAYDIVIGGTSRDGPFDSIEKAKVAIEVARRRLLYTAGPVVLYAGVPHYSEAGYGSAANPPMNVLLHRMDGAGVRVNLMNMATGWACSLVLNVGQSNEGQHFQQGTTPELAVARAFVAMHWAPDGDPMLKRYKTILGDAHFEHSINASGTVAAPDHPPCPICADTGWATDDIPCTRGCPHVAGGSAK